MKFQEEKRIIRSEVEPDAEGMRLDHYLQKRFTYKSRSAWQESVEKGEIRLNGTTTRASRKLHTGEIISFEFPEQEEPEVDRDYGVLLEHERFIAVNKPGQLPVHPAGRFYKNTLQFLLKERFGDVFPVNRLDRETSGVILFARDADAASKLSALFSTEKMLKKYIALVHGKFPDDEIRAEGYLSRDFDSEVRKKRRFTKEIPDNVENESAVTEFRLLKYNNGISMVEAVPETGRLHQIRATLCSSWFPLVGDKLYGLDDRIYLRYIESSMTAEDEKLLRLNRQALHACELIFPNPFGGTPETFHIEAPLPSEFDLLQDDFDGV